MFRFRMMLYTAIFYVIRYSRIAARFTRIPFMLHRIRCNTYCSLQRT